MHRTNYTLMEWYFLLPALRFEFGDIPRGVIPVKGFGIILLGIEKNRALT